MPKHAIHNLRIAVGLLGLAFLFTVAGCRLGYPRPGPNDPTFIDPLLGHHLAGSGLILSNHELLLEFFNEAKPLVLDSKTATDMPGLLAKASKKKPRFLLARALNAHQLSGESAALLRQWVYDGGTLWLRANSSLETWFGVYWKPRKKFDLLNRRLLRDRGEILPHYLTRGVRRLRIVGLGTYVPVTQLAKTGWEPVLRTRSGDLFGVLRYGAGRILFDSSTVDPEERNPYFGIYGFDANVFWANLLAYTGIIQPEKGFKLLGSPPKPANRSAKKPAPEPTNASAPGKKP